MIKISKKMQKKLNWFGQSVLGQSGRPGFSLIELLVVISIIGALAALMVANLVGVRSRAADTGLKNDLNQLKTALRIYYNDHQVYPASSGGVMMGCGLEADSACVPGEEFSAGSGPTIYMAKLPASFTYTAGSDLESFVLATALGNLSDSDIAKSATKCGQTLEASSSAYFVCNN